MNLGTCEIDLIVQEVMRRLLTHDADRRAPIELPSSGGASHQPNSLVIKDRVVTMNRLTGQLAGVTNVQVTRDAVVTPLVVDELRAHGISLERESLQRTKGVEPSMLLVGNRADHDRVAPFLEKTTTQWRHEVNLDLILNNSSLQVRQALVLTPAWAKTVCQINRDPRWRAAVVLNPRMVCQAVEQLNANVLVVDPTAVTDAQLQQVIDEALAGWETRP